MHRRLSGFDRTSPKTIFLSSRPPRVLSRGIALAGRDAGSCGLPMQASPGRRPATPPFRHYERNVRTHQCETKGTAHVHRPTVSPRRARSQQPPRWSAERRAFPLERKAPSDSAFTRVFVALCACGPTSLARRRVPLHPSACRRSASLFRAEGNIQTSEEDVPREKGDLCADLRCPSVMRRAQRRPNSRSISHPSRPPLGCCGRCAPAEGSTLAGGGESSAC